MHLSCSNPIIRKWNVELKITRPAFTIFFILTKIAPTATVTQAGKQALTKMSANAGCLIFLEEK